MRALIALAGFALLIFLLVSFEKVAWLGCYASPLLKREIVLFGSKTTEPVCVREGVYNAALVVSVAMMVLGTAFHLLRLARNNGIDLVRALGGNAPAPGSRPGGPGSNPVSHSGTPQGGAAYDVVKWQALLEYDPDLARANAIVAKHGTKYADILASEYLKIGDKQYLPAIIQKIIEARRADQAAEEALGEQELLLELQTASLFRVTGGHCLITGKSYRCFQFNDDGTVESFPDWHKRAKAHASDKVWDLVTDDRARDDFVARHREEILRGLEEAKAYPG